LRFPFITIAADIRHLEWKEAIEALAMMRVERDRVYVVGRLTDSMVGAIVQDERGFFIQDPQETFKKVSIHLRAEQSFTDAIGLDMKVDKAIAIFKVHLKSHPKLN
jgi:hypothetical protein